MSMTVTKERDINKMYMAVTADEYELPLFVADHIRDLAIWANISYGAARNYVYSDRSGKTKGFKLIKVEIDQ